MAGRFAPTPTSRLHLGNLRTALAAWLAARASGRDFLIRIEDLDQARTAAAAGVAEGQLRDLARLGLNHDGPVVRQSERTALYESALARLDGLVYECFCSRKEIAAAAQAPHGPDGGQPYSGACRDLSAAQRASLRRRRPAALRVRADGAAAAFSDQLAGNQTGFVDDFVLRRGDGVFAYNFAVVVDDAAQGVDQVLRGADLLVTSLRQVWLVKQLGWPVPEYAHLPLAVGPGGRRLAKRDGSDGLSRLAAAGWSAESVTAVLGRSLGLDVPEAAVRPADLVERFALDRIPAAEWTVDTAALAAAGPAGLKPAAPDALV
ncbi:MAG: tRNA glutamyl-Q(34) synthetase GluQRS [Propionibacteriaceae bacterium]|jgi:glutamyl-tRNA synthetase|nr:tRNA glutamyl-Q(34) synthetase GluQRS [Propionibacteriaceae bacterium]